MDKVIEWLKLAIGSFGVKGGFNEIHNATRWSYYDPISWIIDNRKELPVFRLSCYNEEKQKLGIKKSTFPQIYPDEKLRQLELIKGTLTFSAQFLNDPLPSGTQLINPDWIQWYDKIPAKPMRTYMLCDPAISEAKTACQRAIIVISVDEDYNWYIRDYSAGLYPLTHPEKTSFISEIFKLYSAYNPWFTGIEEVGFQKTVAILLQREMDDRGVWFNVTGMKVDNQQTKEMRIETLAKPFGARKVFMPSYMKESELYKQLVGYPAYRWKDLIDALSYLMRYAWPTKIEQIKQPIKENTLADIHRRIDEARYSPFMMPYHQPRGKRNLDESRYAEELRYR